jgi:hypothetical protein
MRYARTSPPSPLPAGEGRRPRQVGQGRCRILLAAFLLLVAGVAPAQHTLPLPGETNWKVMVFGCYFPEDHKQQAAAYTVEAKWRCAGEEHTQTLTGQVKWLETASQELALPPNVEEFSLSLDWEDDRLDLDLGMEEVGGRRRIAPLFTVLKPEKVLYTPEYADLLNWLDTNYPGWTEGYPFWADLEPAAEEGSP